MAPLVPGLVAIGAMALMVAVPGRPPLTRAETILWSATLALPLVQLIPLPPAIWTNLPGHQYPATVMTAIGERPWLPLSLTPSRTLSSFFGLLPAFAIYLAARELPRAAGDRLLFWVAGLAAVSAMLGFLQLAGGEGSALRFYAITNNDAAVGFLSNANHFGTLMAACAPLPVYLLLQTRFARGESAQGPFLVAMGLAVIMLAAAVASFSRAAFGLAGVAVALIAGMLLSRLNLSRRTKIVVGVLSAVAVIGVGAFLLTSDDVARKAVDEVGHDGRVGLIPTFIDMIALTFPAGGGLGSFDPLYRGFEDYRFVDFSYLNNAHNDLAQIIIEAGLFGVLLLLGWLAFIAAAAVRAWRTAGGPVGLIRVIVLGFGLAAPLLHSLVDYPLRGAAISGTFMLFLALMASDAKQRGKESPSLHRSRA